VVSVVVERVEDSASIDHRALFSLLHAAFAYMDERIDPPSSLYGMTIDDLRQKAATETLFLAHAGNRMVGCLFARPETDFVYVGKVAVLPEMASVGIGSAMMKAAFTHAKELETDALELETRVELVENHAFFARFGFVKVSESAHEGYDHPTSIRMRARVTPQ